MSMHLYKEDILEHANIVVTEANSRIICTEDHSDINNTYDVRNFCHYN